MFHHPYTVLDEVSLFEHCSRRSRLTASRLFTGIDVDQGHELVHEGRPGREFFVIHTGHATVTRGGQVVAELGPGDFFGEMALISNEFRNATVTATGPMQVLAANRREFESLMRLDPVLDREIRRAAHERAA